MSTPGNGRSRWAWLWQWLRRQLRDRPVAAGLAIALLAVTDEVIVQVIGNELSARLSWLAHTGIIVAGLGLSVLAAYLMRRPVGNADQPVEAPPATRIDPLPPPSRLLGRDKLIAHTVLEARRHGVVLVSGPSGIGASAVAIEAARELVGDRAAQIYIDLRGQSAQPEDDRRVAVRVLTVLGLQVGPAARLDVAADLIKQTLRDTGRVLVLDNVVDYQQVAWAMMALPGCYLIAAGEVSVRQQHLTVAQVSVGPLDPPAALSLLVAQDGDLAAPRCLQARVQAERSEALRLAADHLKHPRVAIELGRWLAANPQLSIGRLVEDFGRQAGSAVQFILGRQLDGARPAATTLMHSLAALPIIELPDDAIAAAAGQDRSHTDALIEELVQRSLLARVRPARYRVPDEARWLGQSAHPDPTASVKALVRVGNHYAGRATVHAAALLPGPALAEREAATHWFRTEDTALLQLLHTPSPPRELAAALWSIADALDAWFGRENRAADRRAAAAAMLATAKQLDDPAARLTATLRLCAAAQATGELASAEQLINDARLVCRPHHGPAALQVARGMVELASGDSTAAAAAFEDACRLRPRADEAGRVIDLANLGAALIGTDQLRDAHGPLSEALEIAERVGDVAGQAHAQELLGVLAARQRDPDRAIRAWQEAQLNYEQLNDDQGQARCLQHRACLLLARLAAGESDLVDGTGSRREESALAEALLQQSLRLRGDQVVGIGPALAHLHLAELAASGGDPQTAEHHRTEVRAALAPWEGSHSRPEIVQQIERHLAPAETATERR